MEKKDIFIDGLLQGRNEKWRRMRILYFPLLVLKGVKVFFVEAFKPFFYQKRYIAKHMLSMSSVLKKGHVLLYYQRFYQHSRRYYTSFKEQEQQRVYDLLVTPSIKESGAVISLIGASRILGNPNNRMEEFLDSLLKHTQDLSRIEMIVRIDADDDLLFYLDIKRRYGDKMRMRFVIGDRKRGYKGLHELVSETLEYLSDSSQVVFGFTDDCLIYQNAWDDLFIKAIKEYSDNIFFINPVRSSDYMDYENENLFFWLLWTHGPPSLFSVISRKLLEILSSVASKHEGWTPYGNSVLCDSFFSALQMYMLQVAGQRREIEIPGVIYFQSDVIIAQHKEGGIASFSPVAVNSYKAFLKNDVQKVIKEMAQEICKHIEMSEKRVVA